MSGPAENGLAENGPAAKGALPEYSGFSDLRAAAIGYAQQASGQIWTDFNLHDPGVTLLEQSCFALSEIAYQLQHPDRDLLTDPRGHFNFRDLAMFAPRKVLGTGPVTQADLSAWLSACAGVSRVIVTPAPAPAGAGLLDLTVVPASDVGASDVGTGDVGTGDVGAGDDLRKAIASAFDAVRPLGCDRRSITIARTRAIRLSGQVEMMPEAMPEHVAAQIYHAISLILQGAQAQPAQGATRKDVYENPDALWPVRADAPEGTGFRLEPHLPMLRGLPHLRDIGPLQLDPVAAETSGGTALVHDVLHLPREAAEMGLIVTLNGQPAALDPSRLREEYSRISARHIALSHHHLDAADWQVMAPGQRRDFSRRDVDSLLPMIYRAEAQPGLSTYRRAIDGHLAAMTRDLADLPRFFAADTDLQGHDPRIWRQRLAVLDYLIALQGEEMPVTSHSGLHCYLGGAARHRFELSWRLRYLNALPELNATRFGGPVLAPDPGPERPGGFLARLALLADLGAGMGECVLARYGLRLAGLQDGGADIGQAQTDPLAPFRLAGQPRMPDDPLLALGHEPPPAPLGPADLRDLCPWAFDGAFDGALPEWLFHRLLQPGSLFLAPQGTGWMLLLDDGRCPAAAPVRLGRYRDHAGAGRALAALRETWRLLHRGSERAVLIEDIVLRDEAGGFRPHCASLVLTGWTARGSLAAFRRYVAQLIDTHAPAHLFIQPLWLNHRDWQDFRALHADLRAARSNAGPALRSFLDRVSRVQGGAS